MGTTPNSTTLEHVLYEIQMYLETYEYLQELKKQQRILSEQVACIQFQFNMTIESHEVHLRNLMEFFRKESSRENDLIVTHILNDSDDLVIEKDFEKYKHISRSVEHLTKDRTIIDKQQTNKYIDEYYSEFVKRIKTVINELEFKIKDEYKDELKDQCISSMLNDLKGVFEEK